MQPLNASGKEKLREFVTQYEGLEEQKQQLAEQQKELLKAMESEGYNVKAFRKLISDRKKDQEAVEDLENWLDVYRLALGMLQDGGVVSGELAEAA
jgi:uncharacterized protein (UPF0335 family)